MRKAPCVVERDDKKTEVYHPRKFGQTFLLARSRPSYNRINMIHCQSKKIDEATPASDLI